MVSKEKTVRQTEQKANSNKKILLNHIKNDFFESNDKITWSLYVKSVDPQSSSFDFTETNGSIRFKTKDKNFLNQHGTDDSDTLFEWNVDFYDRIQASNFGTKVNQSTMEITLQKAQSNGTKWPSAIKRNISAIVENDDKKNEQNESKPTEIIEPPNKISPNSKNTKINTEEKCNTSLERSSRNRTRSRSPSSSPSPPPYKENLKQVSNYYGYTGLANLGNTCYMNAAIQFLINATDFRDYFLENQKVFQKEINTNNALGLSGKMAVNFALLIRQLWRSNTSYVVPNRLKDLICAKYSNYRGYEQQDTQEFMCSLLSLIHEDLNRVLKKPFYESSLECEDDSLTNTLKIANESWERFLTRENSIVVDNFYGQFKSKLTCPECKKVSITFEPFSNLLVPLAKPKKQTNFLIFIEKNLVFFNLYLKEKETVEEVLNQVRSKFNEFNKNTVFRCYVIEKWSNDSDDDELNAFKFDSYYGVLNPQDEIPNIKNNQLIMITEIDNCEDKNDPVLELRIQQVTKYPITNDIKSNQCSFCEKFSFNEDNQPNILPRCTRCFRSAYCNSDCQKKDWSNHSSTLCCKLSDQVGLPFIITLKKSQLTTENSENYIRKKLLDQSLKSIQLANFDLSKKSIFELEVFESSLNSSSSNGNKKSGLNKIDNKFEKLIDLFENSLTKKSNHIILKAQLKWNNNSSQNMSIKTNLNKVIDLRTERSNENSSVNLDDCLNLFTLPEKLTSDNPWYCSKCKKHQEATKQMNLWKLPKYLIISLKRFQATKASDCLINSNDEKARQMLMNSRFSYFLQNRVVYNKLNTFVHFPLQNLDMSKYLITQESNTKNHIYDLCAVINHLGQSLSIGHYTACARTHDVNDTAKDELSWRLFDDQHVIPIQSENQIVSKDAYVLMYRLRSSNYQENIETSLNLNVNNNEQESNLNQSSSENEDEEFCDVESEESEELNENFYKKNNFTNLNEID